MDNEPIPIAGPTFHTEVDVHVPAAESQAQVEGGAGTGTFSLTSVSSFRNTGSSAQGTRLPLAVNMIALRESFLSEAPFVST